MARYREIVPNTFTMGNIVCGFIAILSTFEGHITTACWFVILAGFLDALDGKVARLSGGTSQLGVELDSLADFLSFGVAPAFLVYVVEPMSLGKWNWVPSVIFITAAAYRLARFNLLAETEEKKEFLGLPVPAAAFFVTSFIIFSYNLWDGLEYGQILVSMLILLSFLMVTQIEYDSFPDKFNTPKERLKLGIIILAGASIVFSPRLLLFPLVSLYILFGVVRELYRLFYAGVGKMTGYNMNRRNEEDKDELEQQ